jgi:hypothetical protein
MIYETPLGLLYPVLVQQREQEELQQQQFPLGQLSECSIPQEPSRRRAGKERHKKECGTIMNKIHTQSLHLERRL